MIIKGNSVGHPLPDPRKGLEMHGGINMNGQPISGLNLPTANDHAANMGFVNQQVRRAAPRNLLDNSDFRNPVNQRGIKDYLQQDSYTIDRWKIYANNGNPGLSVMDGYILFKGGIYQKLDIDANKTYTFAVMTGNNEIICVSGVPTTKVAAKSGNNTVVLGRDYSGSLVQVGIAGVDETIVDSLKWAALYEGEYTAETLPEYQPKGYAAELAECQRYYLKPVQNPLGYGYIYNSTAAIITIPLPIKMRTAPSITYDSLEIIYNGVSVSASSHVIHELEGNAIRLNIPGEYATVGVPAILRASGFVFNADL